MRTKVVITVLSVCLIATVYAHQFLPRADADRVKAEAPVTTSTEVRENSSSMSSPSASLKNSSSSQNAILLGANIASENFRRSKQCVEVDSQIRRMKAQVKSCDAQVSQQDSYSLCRKATSGFAEKIENAQKEQSTCSTDPAVLEKNYKASVAEAARKGDFDAQICYINGGYTLESPAEVEQYKRDAGHYMNSALARGDWRAVDLLATPTESVAQGNVGAMASLANIGSPFTVYRANKLLELGATGYYLSLLRTSAGNAAMRLAPDQITNANAWAKQEYNKYFLESKPLTSAPERCLN
jgi:hypothetical protein